MFSPARLHVHHVARDAVVSAVRVDARTRHRAINVGAVFVCQAFHSLTFIGLALFLPLIREDLQISYTQAGVLSAAATLSYALGQIPAGFLADRFGPRRLFIIGLVGWSTLSLMLGLIHTFWLAVLNLFVAGAFRALLFAPGLALLASWYPKERGAMAMSLYMLGAYTGNIVLALAGPALTAALGWRSAFMLFAAAGICAALAFYALGSERARAASARPFAIREAMHLLRHKVLWLCSAIQVVRFSAVTGLVFWLPSMLVADRGFSLQAVGWVVAFKKFAYLKRGEKGTAEFLRRWKTVSSDLTVIDHGDSANVKSLGGTVADEELQELMQESPLYQIYHIGSEEIHQRITSKRGFNGLSVRSITAIKASLDAGLTREVHRLNSGLVSLTIGIAGGPYVGLMGTVVGVMITFAVIAKTGQVEVNSIAPGIASALLATVFGLLVAIPALFLYSFLNSRIKDAVSDMQLFIDEFITKMAEFYPETDGRSAAASKQEVAAR